MKSKSYRKTVLLPLGVVNNGFTKTDWTIESFRLGMYLRGHRETSFGANKLILSCEPGSGLTAIAIFDPQGRQDEVVGMRAISFMIDGKQRQMPANLVIENPTINNGWINVQVKIDSQLL